MTALQIVVLTSARLLLGAGSQPPLVAAARWPGARGAGDRADRDPRARRCASDGRNALVLKGVRAASCWTREPTRPRARGSQMLLEPRDSG